MIFGREVGNVVSVALDGRTDVEGDGATTMLGSTIKDVALSVPVGLILCGGALVTTIAGVSVGLAVDTASEMVAPEAVVTPEIEPDAVTTDSEAAPADVARLVADAVAASVPDVVPGVAEELAGTLPDAVAEVWTPVSDAVPEIAELVTGADPDAVPEVMTPVASAEPEVTGSVADAVPGVTEADGESLKLVTGMTGTSPELDVIGATEDRPDVSTTGTTEVGTDEETSATDTIEDKSDEASDATDPGVGRPEGSNEDAVVMTGAEVCPVPRREVTTPLDGTVGKIPIGVVESAEDAVVMETDTPVLVADVPRIVSRPTVIPEDEAKGVAASVILDTTDEIGEVIAGMTLEGRKPEDDSARETVGTEGVVRGPLVSEVKRGTIGDTRPVLDVGVVDSGTRLPVEKVSVSASGTLDAVPAEVGAALVDAMTLVDSNVEPRSAVDVTTTDDTTAGDEVRLETRVTVEPKESIEPVPLEGGDVDLSVTLLTDVGDVGIDEVMITGDDSVIPVRLDPEDGKDVTRPGIELAGIDDAADVSTVAEVGSTTADVSTVTEVGNTTADVSPGKVVMTDVSITTDDGTADGDIVTEVGTATGVVSPDGMTVVDEATTTSEDSTGGKMVNEVGTTTGDVSPGGVTFTDVATITDDESTDCITTGDMVAEGDVISDVRDSTGKVGVPVEGT
jgi:hypothetical protein